MKEKKTTFVPCSCYNTDYEHPRCFGTKECDECTCGGNSLKCDFYPEKIERTIKELKENGVNQTDDVLIAPDRLFEILRDYIKSDEKEHVKSVIIKRLKDNCHCSNAEIIALGYGHLIN